jgi:hypothetical protein
MGVHKKNLIKLSNVDPNQLTDDKKQKEVKKKDDTTGYSSKKA